MQAACIAAGQCDLAGMAVAPDGRPEDDTIVVAAIIGGDMGIPSRLALPPARR
jgi:hypothetical protein